MWERWGCGSHHSAVRAKAICEDEFVLYADTSSSEGIWAPLQCLFWSSESHVLVSSHPESSTVECASVYCPSCFEYWHDAASVRGGCPSCFECPVCSSSSLSRACSLAGKFHLRCTHCPWDSLPVVSAESPEALEANLDHILSGGNGDVCSPKALENTFASLVTHFAQTDKIPPTASEPDCQRSASWSSSDADASERAKRDKPGLVPLEGSPLYASEELRRVKNPMPSLSLGTGCGVAQRLSDPARQPATVQVLLPRRRQLLARKERLVPSTQSLTAEHH